MAIQNPKILVCCMNGAGSSLMLKMTVQKVLDKLGIKAEKVYHCALAEGEAVAGDYDVVLCAENFIPSFKEATEKGVHVIGLQNIMSVQEIEQKLKEHEIA